MYAFVCMHVCVLIYITVCNLFVHVHVSEFLNGKCSLYTQNKCETNPVISFCTA